MLELWSKDVELPQDFNTKIIRIVDTPDERPQEEYKATGTDGKVLEIDMFEAAKRARAYK